MEKCLKTYTFFMKMVYQTIQKPHNKTYGALKNNLNYEERQCVNRQILGNYIIGTFSQFYFKV